MTITPQQYRDKHVGKGCDPDHYAGFQCVDEFDEFCIEMGYSYPLVEGAKDFYQAWLNNRGNLKDNFESIAFENKKDGDWFIYNGIHGGGYGHVGMFVQDNGNGTCVLFGQNQGAPNGVANYINLSYNGLLIILRPKCWSKNKKETSKEEKKEIKNEPDQILTKGSKVKFQYEYTVGYINTKNDTVYIVELGAWIHAPHLVETKNG